MRVRTEPARDRLPHVVKFKWSIIYLLNEGCIIDSDENKPKDQ